MMPAGLPMPSLPSLGGGGIPGLGGGDPLSALSGLGGAGAHGQDPGFEDRSGHPDSARRNCTMQPTVATRGARDRTGVPKRGLSLPVITDRRGRVRSRLVTR